MSIRTGLGIILLSAFLATPLQASDANERLALARQYARESSGDFAFLEYRAYLREEPEARRAPEAFFALGEYYFQQQNFLEAKDAFEKFKKTAPKPSAAMLTDVYLMRCAQALNDEAAAQQTENGLKEALSSKKLFLAFKEHRTKDWISPLGNRYRFRESVDRMEIFLNASPFHTVSLP